MHVVCGRHICVLGLYVPYFCYKIAPVFSHKNLQSSVGLLASKTLFLSIKKKGINNNPKGVHKIHTLCQQCPVNQDLARGNVSYIVISGGVTASLTLWRAIVFHPVAAVWLTCERWCSLYSSLKLYYASFLI